VKKQPVKKILSREGTRGGNALKKLDGMPIIRTECKDISEEKKKIETCFFSGMLVVIPRQCWALPRKKSLTSRDCSDNQDGKQVLFVYNSKCGPTVAGRWGLIKGGFGYG
jgi:hypothetical protein